MSETEIVDSARDKELKTPKYIRNATKAYYERKKDDPEFKKKNADNAREWRQKNKEKHSNYQSEWKKKNNEDKKQLEISSDTSYLN
jgi:hypothetical protein